MLVILATALWLATRDPLRTSIVATFLCYTNKDTRGFNERYTWAWFRIENRSPFMLLCQQGPLDIQRSGLWVQDTNRLGFQYEPIIEPGETLTISMMPPTNSSQWRSSFWFTKMSIHSGTYWTWRFRLAAFRDRHPHLFPFGSKPTTSGHVVITSTNIIANEVGKPAVRP